MGMEDTYVVKSRKICPFEQNKLTNKETDFNKLATRSDKKTDWQKKNKFLTTIILYRKTTFRLKNVTLKNSANKQK